MSSPTIIINIYSGTPGCGCSGVRFDGQAAGATTVNDAKKSEIDAALAKLAGDPPDSIPPCGACYWSVLGPGSIYVNATLNQTLPGGPNITGLILTILNTSGTPVGSTTLGNNGNATAGQSLTGSYTVPNVTVRNAAQGVLSYIGSDGIVHTSSLPKH